MLNEYAVIMFRNCFVFPYVKQLVDSLNLEKPFGVIKMMEKLT